ncbi:DUF4468 domain-containing protein [Vicingaceae bacterium]|nr:DUF4468 domain-containing protein [Vicingaceae bacterium]
MRFVAITISILFGLNTSAQDTTFTYSKNGFTDYVVSRVEGKSAVEIYTKTIEWITLNFKVTDKVIQGKIENEFIRLEGGSKIISIYNTTTGGGAIYDALYQIEISIKDNRYKFDVVNIRTYIEPDQYVQVSGWQDVNFYLDQPSVIHKKNGLVKKKFQYIPKSFTSHFNSLNMSLKSYILGNDTPSKKDDW